MNKNLDALLTVASAAQLDVPARLERLVRVAKPPAYLPSPEEAARVLLGSDRLYDGGALLSMGSYDVVLVSVPSIGSRPVDLCSRLPEPARLFLVLSIYISC